MRKEVAAIAEAVHNVSPIYHAMLDRTTRISSHDSLPLGSNKLHLGLFRAKPPVGARTKILKAVEAAARKVGCAVERKQGHMIVWPVERGKRQSGFRVYFEQKARGNPSYLIIDDSTHPGDERAFRTFTQQHSITI